MDRESTINEGQIIESDFGPVYGETAQEVIDEVRDAFKNQKIESITWRGAKFVRAADGLMVQDPPVILNDDSVEKY
jgi:hypothetical protein